MQAENMLRKISVSTAGLEEHAERRVRSAQAKGITDPAKLACIRAVEMIDVAKGGLPMLAPGVFRENRKKKENCERITCAWFDFDGETPETWSQGVAKLTTAGIAWFAYSSPKNGVKKTPKDVRDVRRRLAVATSRDMSPAEAEKMQRIVPEILGLTVDDKTHDCSRGFFVGTVPSFTQLVWEAQPTGLALDVDAILAKAPAPTPTPESPPIEGQSADADEEEGRRLALTMPPAIQGQSGGATTLSLMRALVWGLELDRATAKEIFLEIFNPRCQPPWSDDAQIEHKLDDASKPEGAPYAKGALRSAPVADENLRLCPDGCPWIVQQASYYWHRESPAGSYTDAFPATELGVRLERDLSRFVRVHTEGTDEKPSTRFGISTIEKLYVMPAAETRADYMARENTFEPATRVLTLATLKWAPIEPTYHEDVDRWLRILGGPSYDNLAQWIASLPALDRPAPILYMHAWKNTGKTLLATGLARLWGHSPGDFSEAISAFNGEQEKTPLLFADEGLPAKLDFQRLRSMVTEHSRRINEKFRPKYTLYGCARIFIAANNDDVLRYQRTGTLTGADVDAIADRLLVVTCPEQRSEEARRLLETVNTREWADHKSPSTRCG
jgi:hypothetical protein